MKSEIEEINIELNPKLKQRGALEFTSLRPIFLLDDRYTSLLLKTPKTIYHCSSNLDEAKFISGLEKHPIIEGYYKAYADHIPISLNADILWNLIVQGFCHHIDQNSEKLRDKFVQFEGQKKISVDGDEEAIELITKEGWENTFDEFVNKIKEHVGDNIINIFTPKFTTTNHIIQVSSQIAIMSAFKNYFQFIRMYGGCGFPYINLQGSLDDYLQLKVKTQALKGYDIDDWIQELIIIIDKIIETKKGKIDKNFWNNIIKNKDIKEPGLSGDMEIVEYIDGWLLNFYPYYQSNDKPSSNNRFIKRKVFNKPIRVKDIKDLPEDLVEVPLIMHNKETGKDTELTVKSGVLGMIQEKNGLIKPEIGYYIANKLNGEEAQKKFFGKKDE